MKKSMTFPDVVDENEKNGEDSNVVQKQGEQAKNAEKSSSTVSQQEEEAETVEGLSSEVIQEEEKPPKLCCSVRVLFSIMCFIAMFNVSYVRVAISMALVCMVDPNPKDKGKTSSDFVLLNFAVGEKKEFHWSATTQGYLMSAVFYGFILGPFFGGFLSFKFGGKIILVIGTISIGITNLLAPEAARLTPYLFFAVRVLTGFFGGFVFPAFYDLVSHWIVPEERQLLVTAALVSIPLASVVNFPIGGFICEYFGWIWLFYVVSIWIVFWGITFVFTLFDYPERCPFISAREMDFINSKIPKTVKHKLPWKMIVKSLPIYAYIVMHFSMNYVYLTIIFNLPLLLSRVHKLTLKENSLLSATPFMGSFCTRILMSLFFEQVRLKLKLSKNTLRKINVFTGAFLVSIFLLVITFLSSRQRYWVVGCLVLASSSLELCISGGYLTSLLDLCPSYVNVLTGVANTVGNTAGLISPVVNSMLTSHETKEEYNSVFYVTISVLVVSVTFYLVFGQNSLQHWGLATLPSMIPVPRTSLIN